MPLFKGNKLFVYRSRILEEATYKSGWRHRIWNRKGDSYVGQWKNDQKDGKGSLVTNTQYLYEGDFECNQRNGFGVLAKEIENLRVFKLIYRGDWKDGKMHGFGVKIFPNGNFYVGNWVRGKRDGYGKMWYKSGSYYEGYWKDNIRQGIGMLVLPSGNRYEGYWLNGMKHGKGIFYHFDAGQAQLGVWRDDICRFSKISDMQFRQTALRPTKYPIIPIELKYIHEVCDLQEDRVLNAVDNLCILFTHEYGIDADDEPISM